MDIGSRADLFFKKYNIPQQECTLEHREVLEEIRDVFSLKDGNEC